VRKALHSTSLLLICPAPEEFQPECPTALSKTRLFKGTYAFRCSGLVNVPPAIHGVPVESIGRSLTRRIQFFAEDEHVPFLLAPLLVRFLWQQYGSIENIVIRYPGVPLERFRTARKLISSGFEAVLLRRDKSAPLVIALARNLRNERLVNHWADCVEQYSRTGEGQRHFDLAVGAQLAEYLCDRIASLRSTGPEQSSPNLDSSLGCKRMPAFIREAVSRLLPESQLLLDDPFENAVPALNAPSSKTKQDHGNLITSLVFLTWSARPDLQTAFDLSTIEGRRGLVDWFLGHAPGELRVTEEFLAPLRAARENVVAAASDDVPIMSTTENSPIYGLRPRTGVNLIGYSRADMGLGEQLRQCAAAFSTTTVPFCVVDFHFGIAASQTNMRFENLTRADNPFNVNLFHINADQMRLVREKLGPEFFRDRYNIGYWAWELSGFPREWRDSIDLMDEIWAPSRFVRNAIAAKTSKPVIWMPLAVEFSRPAERDAELIRERLNLPKRKFLFLFSFDFSSFASRKNFKGCIEAFRRAFPKPDAETGLVLKTIRHPHQTRQYWELLRAVGDDSRIFIVDRVLPQVEMHELMLACDAFVSLHRSEGFGLGIAEAMYLGKPVVATNYSGNTDFTKPDNSCLVPYRLITLEPGDYLFSEGQQWADPDLDAAAECMRRLAADRTYAMCVGRAAAEFIRERHSCEKVGEQYTARLRQIESARISLASPSNSGE
jgi:glycosyltransferase involved in cell wall biosynthesis